MFDHVKRLKDWMAMACYAYDSKYCKVLTIDMQSQDDLTYIIFWEILSVVMAKNGVPNVNLKGFMINNAHADWNILRKIYEGRDQL